MKLRNILTFFLFSSFTPLASIATAQEASVEQKTAERANKANILNKRFSNLPAEKRRKYLKLRADAHRYFRNKRTFETLMAVYEMKDIFEDDPVAYNLLGAVYVEFRDFSKAREIFRKAVDLAGDDPKVLFNLAELEFCDNQWESSIQHFKILLKNIDSQSDTEFSRLIEFKILLCKLALSKAENETVSDNKKKEYLSEAKQLASKYSYLIDSPFYYYANAALSFYEGNRDLASKYLITAKKVFSNRLDLVTSWDDTIVEFGYIEAHYGKHFSEDAEIDSIPEL